MEFEEVSSAFKKPNKRLLGWTSQQEETIMACYKEYGPDWKKISEKLDNRSPNSVKNKVNCNQKKLVNKVNLLLKRAKKSVQVYAVNKFLFLTSPGFTTELTQQQNRKFKYLRNLIIDNSFQHYDKFSEEQAKQIFSLLKQFNISFRHTNARKVLFMAKNKGNKIKSKLAAHRDKEQQIKNLKIQQGNQYVSQVLPEIKRIPKIQRSESHQEPKLENVSEFYNPIFGYPCLPPPYYPQFGYPYFFYPPTSYNIQEDPSIKKEQINPKVIYY